MQTAPSVGLPSLTIPANYPYTHGRSLGASLCALLVASHHSSISASPSSCLGDEPGEFFKCSTQPLDIPICLPTSRHDIPHRSKSTITINQSMRGERFRCVMRSKRARARCVQQKQGQIPSTHRLCSKAASAHPGISPSGAPNLPGARISRRQWLACMCQAFRVSSLAAPQSFPCPSALNAWRMAVRISAQRSSLSPRHGISSTSWSDSFALPWPSPMHLLFSAIAISLMPP